MKYDIRLGFGCLSCSATVNFDCFAASVNFETGETLAVFSCVLWSSESDMITYLSLVFRIGNVVVYDNQIEIVIMFYRSSRAIILLS